MSLSPTIFSTILLAFSCVAPMSAKKKEKLQEFKITTRECQPIDGFGASDAWSFWQIGTWEDSLQTQVADWLFSSETDSNGNPKGIALSIWRFNAGAGSATQGEDAKINRDTRTEYFSNQVGQRRFLRLAKERGVPTFLAFFNSPPVNLTINGLGTNTGRGGTLNLREDCYDDFARYSADMIETAEREDGIHFDYVCPVNEPDGHWNWQGPKQEGTPASNREIARLAKAFSQEYVRRGLTSQILINESSDYRCMIGEYQAGWQRGNEIQCFWNPDSVDTYVGNLPNVAHIMAGHSYWTNTPVLRPGNRRYDKVGLYGYRKVLADEFNKLKDKPVFWQTELCIMSNDEEIHGGGGFDFTMEEALYVARVMHYDLTVAQAQSWQWWRAAGGNYKDGLIRMYVRGERTGGGRGANGIPQQRRGAVQSNMVRDSKLMWTMGNFSRFVRPGAIRLDVEGRMEVDGLMLSAYRNQDGSLAVVAINYGKEDATVSLKGFGKTATPYRTSDVEGENLKRLPDMKLSSTFLPARSVTTLVIAK